MQPQRPEGYGFIPVARRWWWLLLAGALAAGLTAYAVTSRIAPTYEAIAKLLTGPINADFGTVRASGELARTYSELVTSNPLLEPTRLEFAAQVPPEDFREAVSATSNEVTRLVTIRVRDNDAERAVRIANALAERLTELTASVPPQQTEAIDELMRQDEILDLTELERGKVGTAARRVFGQPFAGRVQVIDPARRPTEPVAPRTSLITVLAMLAGLLGTGVFVILRESSRAGFESEQELLELADVPSLGTVAARGSRRRATPLVLEAAPGSATADGYRLVATRIAYSNGDRPIRSLLVVGVRDQMGSGTLAANLAAALAGPDLRVTLVDADQRGREVTRLFALDGEPGYSDVIAGVDLLTEEVLDTVRVSHSDGLDILPRGGAEATGLLELERAAILLLRLRASADFVMISAPPADRSSGTLIWARAADATVLVVEPGRSSPDDVRRAVESVKSVGGNLIGTISTQKLPRGFSRRGRPTR